MPTKYHVKYPAIAACFSLSTGENFSAIFFATFATRIECLYVNSYYILVEKL